jgi:hypothetical protein
MMKRLQEMKQRAALAWRILRDTDGNLVAHARTEFEAGGYGDGDAMNAAMASCVLDLIRVYSSQGHSGFSASHCRGLFAEVAAFKPLGQLTGADSEWFDHGHDDRTRWQNKRASHVFKGADGVAYDIDAVVFEEPDGSRFTSGHSCMPVNFPYAPRSVVVRIPADATDAQKKMMAQQAWAAA